MQINRLTNSNIYDAKIDLETGALDLKFVTQDCFAKASRLRGFFYVRVIRKRVGRAYPALLGLESEGVTIVILNRRAGEVKWDVRFCLGLDRRMGESND